MPCLGYVVVYVFEPFIAFRFFFFFALGGRYSAYELAPLLESKSSLEEWPCHRCPVLLTAVHSA